MFKPSTVSDQLRFFSGILRKDRCCSGKVRHGGKKKGKYCYKIKLKIRYARNLNGPTCVHIGVVFRVIFL